MATIIAPRRKASVHSLALDYSKSNRRVDADGRLHVSDCPITKATVNGYYGWEIPNWEDLGLNPKKEYMLLRDPIELEKAAHLFDGTPLLDTHIPHDADETVKKNVAGAVGAGCTFDGEYVRTPLLSIWGQEDIDAIDNEEKRELSASYGYDPEMKPGVFKGLRYDGRMVNIVPNHVALVARGRAGRDVLVMDGFPKGQKMKKSQFDRFARKAKGLFANDADIDPEELVKLISHAAGAGAEEDDDAGADDDDNNDDPNAMDAACPKGAMDYLKGKLSADEMGELGKAWTAPKADDAEEDDDGEGGGEEDDDDKGKKGKGADDSARRSRRRAPVAMDAVAIRKQIVGELAAWDRAREKVQPHIGRVKLAMDEVPGGAATLYRRALTAHNVPHARVMDLNALEAMVDMIPAPSRPTLAHDAAHDEASPLDAILTGSVKIVRS